MPSWFNKLGRKADHASSSSSSAGVLRSARSSAETLVQSEETKNDSKAGKNTGGPKQAKGVKPGFAYPWSNVKFNLLPQIPLLGSDKSVACLSAIPFPRVDATLIHVPATGKSILFGGLVSDHIPTNDTFIVSYNDRTIVPFPTSGDVPAERSQHAVGVIDNTMILFGGDSRDVSSGMASLGPLDDSTYALDLSSYHWTKLRTSGPAPSARVNHCISTVGSKLYLFGGFDPLNEVYFDDVWMLDLGHSPVSPQWIAVGARSGERPAQRSNTSCAAYGDKLVVFGGSDDDSKYNDTWAFDTVKHVWEEWKCIGFVPTARNSHKAAIVGDKMYIYGGQDVNGQDLDEIQALHLPVRKWYVFKNMGPVPSARSGHAMTVVGTQVMVCGGKSTNGSVEGEDRGMIHIMETSGFTFPAGAVPPSRS